MFRRTGTLCQVTVIAARDRGLGSDDWTIFYFLSVRPGSAGAGPGLYRPGLSLRVRGTESRVFGLGDTSPCLSQWHSVRLSATDIA